MPPAVYVFFSSSIATIYEQAPDFCIMLGWTLALFVPFLPCFISQQTVPNTTEQRALHPDGTVSLKQFEYWMRKMRPEPPTPSYRHKDCKMRFVRFAIVKRPTFITGSKSCYFTCLQPFADLLWYSSLTPDICLFVTDHDFDMLYYGFNSTYMTDQAGFPQCLCTVQSILMRTLIKGDSVFQDCSDLAISRRMLFGSWQARVMDRSKFNLNVHCWQEPIEVPFERNKLYCSVKFDPDKQGRMEVFRVCWGPDSEDLGDYLKVIERQHVMEYGEDWAHALGLIL
jgi:hypothetical protein